MGGRRRALSVESAWTPRRRERIGRGAGRRRHGGEGVQQLEIAQVTEE